MADEAEQGMEFAPREEPEEPGATAPRSRAALVLAIVGLVLLGWFFLVLVGHAQDWRARGEEWAGLDTEQWMWVLAALFVVVLIAEAVLLFRRITARSGEYLGGGEAPRDDEAVVVGEAERAR